MDWQVFGAGFPKHAYAKLRADAGQGIPGAAEAFAAFIDDLTRYVIRFIDINDKLANGKGELYEGMTDPDKLHLSLKAYQIWADALKPHLEELLGPRASIDKAPPPTGDPSAKK